MMYAETLSVPADTKENAKVSTSMIIGHGVIHQIDVLIPEGTKQMVKVQLFDGGRQFHPAREDESISSNGHLITGKVHYKLQETRDEITIKAFSPDTANSHIITVYVWVLPERILMPRTPIQPLIDAITKALQFARLK